MNQNTLEVIEHCKILQQELDTKCNECRRIVKNDTFAAESIWHSSLDFYQILFKEQFDKLNWDNFTDEERLEFFLIDNMPFQLMCVAFDEDCKQRYRKGWH